MAGTESTPRQCFVSPAPTRYARDASRLAGSPSPCARTVNAKRWVQNAQAVSRFGGESKSPRADGQCKVMGSECPGSVPF